MIIVSDKILLDVVEEAYRIAQDFGEEDASDMV